MEVHTGLLHYRTLGLETSNNAQTQLAEKLTTSRIHPKWQCDIAADVTKSLHTSEDAGTNNPVYKLMVVNLQQVLITVVIRSIFEH